MTSDLLFKTARLSARRMTGDDVEALLAVYGDAEAMIWVDDGNPITREECERWVEVTARNYAQRGYGMSVIEARSPSSLVGFCGLVHPGGQVEPEIKYALLRSHWGQGLATEVVQRMLLYGREEFGMTEIIATVAPANLASKRVLAKCGMKLCETRTDDDGSQTDVLRLLAGSAISPLCPES